MLCGLNKFKCNQPSLKNKKKIFLHVGVYDGLKYNENWTRAQLNVCVVDQRGFYSEEDFLQYDYRKTISILKVLYITFYLCLFCFLKE